MEQVKKLLENYQSRLRIGQKLLNTLTDEKDKTRVEAKLKTYRYFIIELERCLKQMAIDETKELEKTYKKLVLLITILCLIPCPTIFVIKPEYLDSFVYMWCIYVLGVIIVSPRLLNFLKSK